MTELKIINQAENYVKKLLENDFSGHDFDHAKRVKEKALFIQRNEGGDFFIIALASLLHDVDDHKLFPENTNNENTRAFLKEINLDGERSEKIIEIINQISFKGKDSVSPSSLEGKIVQDADRLDAIGAIGIARAFAYGGTNKRKLYDFSQRPRTEMSFEEYKATKTATLTHFYEKLLHLKDMMNTKTAIKMATYRHEFMRLFLEEFLNELNLSKDF